MNQATGNCQLSSVTCQSYWFTKHIVTIFISFYSLFIVFHRPNSSTSPLGTTSHIGGASHSNIETARPAWRVSSVLRCQCNFSVGLGKNKSIYLAHCETSFTYRCIVHQVIRPLFSSTRHWERDIYMMLTSIV